MGAEATMTKKFRHPMRVLFVGRDNAFNRGICAWLDVHFDLVGAFFNEPDRFTPRSRIRKVRARIRRYGLLRAVDELVFQFVSTLTRRLIRERARWPEKIDRMFLDPPELDCPTFAVSDVHDERWLEKLREFDVDIAVAACGTVIYRKEFYDMPRHGTFVIHEGLTPEYKGLHTAVWAMMKDESQYLGVTLLKIDDTIDGGRPIFQKRYELDEDEGVLSWSLVAHRAVVEALPEMADTLRELSERGDFEAVDTGGRKGGYYSWMPMSRFLILAIRNFRNIRWR